VLNQLSNPYLRIRAFGLILSLLMGVVQLLASIMLMAYHDGEFTLHDLFKLSLNTLFSLAAGQLVLTVFIHRGLESALAWLAAIGGMLVYGVVDTLIVTLLEQASLPQASQLLLIFGIRMTSNVLWMYGVWLGATLFMLSQQRVAEERQRALMLERAQFETRLSFLESQINPHFLFNALNTVASLIVLERAPDARSAVVDLGHLLRRSLNGEGNPLATLADEIAAAKAYLTIEKLRFADRLAVEWDIQPGLEMTTLPRFSLQPLIENVVKHAVAHAPGVVHARISARHRHDDIEISVWNDGIAGTTCEANIAETGVGLRNLRQRLDLLYAGHAAMSVRRLAAGEFECHLILPGEVMMEAAQ
jgi:sensor histidine kinase YesM